MNDDICDNNNNTSGFANGYNMTMLIVIDNVKKNKKYIENVIHLLSYKENMC
jgi:hypothetical protein